MHPFVVCSGVQDQNHWFKGGNFVEINVFIQYLVSVGLPERTFLTIPDRIQYYIPNFKTYAMMTHIVYLSFIGIGCIDHCLCIVFSDSEVWTSRITLIRPD